MNNLVLEQLESRLIDATKKRCECVEHDRITDRLSIRGVVESSEHV